MSDERDGVGYSIVFVWILLSFGYCGPQLSVEFVVSEGLDVSIGELDSYSLLCRLVFE